MKKPILSILALAAAPVAQGEVRSPLEMAAELEARTVAGDDVTLPDPATEIVRTAGAVDLARGDWPTAFLDRVGKTICVAVSPFTGNYEFFDETGDCFFTLVPAFPTTENWVAPFRHAEEGTFPDDDLYAPWRLVDVWTLSFGRDAPTARPHPHAEFAESAELGSAAPVRTGGASSPSGPWGENPPEGTVQIRRSGAANEWLTLGSESDLAPWTARIAGHFDLRGIVPCGGFSVTTAVQQIEVQFPSGAQIAADEGFISAAEWAWTLMTSEASEPPHAQREYGFCVFLDTSDQEYDCSDIQQGPFIPPYGNGEIAIDCDPVTNPDSPSPTACGARYAVATFHTHPPAAYAFEGWSRPTGPSSNDVSNAMTRGLPSVVSDYVPLDNSGGDIFGGHDLDAEHQRILIPAPIRRATP